MKRIHQSKYAEK